MISPKVGTDEFFRHTLRAVRLLALPGFQVLWERKVRFALSLCKESVKYNVKCLHYDEACHYSGQDWNDHWNSSSP